MLEYFFSLNFFLRKKTGWLIYKATSLPYTLNFLTLTMYERCIVTIYCLIRYCIYQKPQGSHCETREQWVFRVLKSVCVSARKITACLWFSLICRLGFLHWHVEFHEQNGRFYTSQQLLFLLTHETKYTEISVLYF